MKMNIKNICTVMAFAVLLMTLCSCKEVDENVPANLILDGTSSELSLSTGDESINNTDVNADIDELPKTTDAEDNTYDESITHSIENQDDENVVVSEIVLSTYEVTLSVSQSKMPIVAMTPSNATDKSEIWLSSNENVATVDAKGNITAVDEGECIVTVIAAANTSVYADVKVVVSKAEVQSESNSNNAEITYIEGILIVNKTYALPSDYAPGVNEEASKAYEKMQMAANDEGLNIYISSGYRSYEYQDGLYNRYVNNHGKAEADRFSARAGHSEHQTGLAFDLNSIDDSFKDTDEGKWVAKHCHEYGFIIRYPEGKESITGYKYEPWHIRYLGVETATAVYESGLTLEEYLGITSAYKD